MKKSSLIFAALGFGALGVLTLPSHANARDQISIAGSSTVFPFSTVVAETFARNTNFKAPVVESVGTGGGFKLFCQGVGQNSSDISNASRAIKPSEIKLCADNGVNDIIEVKIGYDGIVLAHDKDAPDYKLSKAQIFLALAKTIADENGKLIDNPYQKWSDIDPSLPATKIEVLGPPPTSGTRDAFLELVMEEGAKSFPAIKALDKNQFKAVAHGLREDGAYIDAGENDNLIIQKLQANPTALGIFGFSFLEENEDKVTGVAIDGFGPEYDNIVDGSYPVSRPLFFYVKKDHIGVIPGLEEFMQEFISTRAIGEEGYLVDKGLIPLGEDEYNQLVDNVSNLVTLNQ